MSTKGYYNLDLTCEGKQEDVRPGLPCVRRQTFRNQSRMHAKAAAREAGWLISKDGNAFCPEHATARRRSRREQ